LIIELSIYLTIKAGVCFVVFVRLKLPGKCEIEFVKGVLPEEVKIQPYISILKIKLFLPSSHHGNRSQRQVRDYCEVALTPP